MTYRGPSKGANGICAFNRIPHIRHHSANNRRRCTSKQSTQKAAQHDGFDILRYGNWYLEDCEDDKAYEEWNFATKDLACRAKDYWAESKPLRN
jgi:hypothetical protein